jgi:hypothetical protein
VSIKKGKGESMGSFIGIKPRKVSIEKYSQKKLCELIADIREHGGIPMIRTKYADAPIVVDGEKCILVVGYKGGKSQWLCGVPEKDIMEYEMMAGDFKRILPSCSPDIIKRVQSAPPPFTE